MPFLLTIRERNHSWAGRPPATSTHATREDAEAALVAYVRENWNAEIGAEPPESRELMIEEYFDDVLEAYEILEQTGATEQV